MPSPSPCLVWDFFGPFSGSGHYNGHIVPLWVRQNTCQEWSRLITEPVKVGGPLVTQCSAPILSFIPCFWRRRLFNGPLQLSMQVFHQFYSPSCKSSLRWGSLLEFVVCVCTCVCVYVGGCSCKALTPPQRWMVLARHVTHSGVPLTWGHTEQFDVYVRTLECRFHILPDNEIKEVPSEKGIPAIPLPAADLLLRHGELVRSIYAALFSVFFVFNLAVFHSTRNLWSLLCELG